MSAQAEQQPRAFPTEISAEALAEADDYIGVDLSIIQYNEEASVDTIRHFAHGIGDGNPLFTDEAYAQSTPYGKLVAPPLFPYSIFSTIIAPGMPGIQSIYARSIWTFSRPIVQGDRIHARARLVAQEVKEGRRAGRFVLQTGETTYTDAKSATLAVCKSEIARIVRNTGEGGLRHEPRPQYIYTADELAAIEEAALAEPRRGGTPLYGEDVNPGDALPAVVKGPYELEDLIVFYTGALPDHYHSAELRWRNRKHVVANNLDPRRYLLPQGGAGHQNARDGVAVGMPGAYDNGCQRTSWFGHLLSNWIGDAGFVSSLDVRLLEPNIHGDATWCEGVVERVEQGDDGWEAKIALRGRNQLDTTTVVGTATVRLPARP